MRVKFARFVAAVAIVVGIVGNFGSVGAARGAGAQELNPPRASQPQPVNKPALSLPPASSLGVQFVQYATADNITGHQTIIDNPLTNGQPDAILIVTPNYGPGGACACVYDDHPIAVWYSGGTWRIFNQDFAAMTVGAAFNVLVPTPGANVFVHTAAAPLANTTYINNAVTNGHPNAMLFITANYNPGGVCGCIYDSNPTGVFYLSGAWGIYNQNGINMPANAKFNVFVPPAGAGVFVHTAVAGNSSGDHTTIDNALTNGHLNALVFATPNYGPGGICGCVNDTHNFGVYFALGKWRIFNQDLAPMQPSLNNAAFNVLVLVPAWDVFVQTASAANIAGAHTTIDNPLTNGHPNAIVFTTPNYEPNGILDNHNLGMVFGGTGQWSIFHQDLAIPTVGSAFNVLIPTPGANVFVHKTTSITVSGNVTVIDSPLTNGHADAMLLVTPNFDPGDVGGTFDDHPIGVYYFGSQWAVFNEDLASMPLDAAFNVMVLLPVPNSFVHTSGIGNIAGDHTKIDNPLTNGNPNAIVLVTPNFDPGGVVGTYLNHRIGVYYTGSQWAIFNQDLVNMPPNESFNVTVYFKDFLPMVTN